MSENLLVTLADEPFLDHAKVVFASAVANGGWTGDMMLLANNIADENLKWFLDLKILVYKCTNVMTKFCRYELFTEYFKKWEHVLYLDADTYVAHALDELFTYPYGFWAVPDAGTPTLRGYGFTEEDPVFNAGMWWFATEQNSENKKEQILALAEELNARMPYFWGRDQHILNYYFKAKWSPLPSEYNLLMGIVLEKGHVFREVDGIVMHLTPDHTVLYRYFEEKIRKCLHLFESHQTAVTKLSRHIDYYKDNLIEVKIRRGDYLYKLFGERWQKIYNSPVNEGFRKAYPDPSFIDTSTGIVAAPTEIVDNTHPARIENIVAAEFIMNILGKNQVLVGAEIGCLFGQSSAALLSRFPNLKLYMVDAWLEYPGIDYDYTGVGWNMQKLYEAAMLRTDFAGNRRIVLRGLSDKMAANVTEPLDFIFIDANHDYEYVKQDLEAWYLKIKPGGLFSGHDWLKPGVMKAVKEFAEKVHRNVVYTQTSATDDGAWYFE